MWHVSTSLLMVIKFFLLVLYIIKLHYIVFSILLQFRLFPGYQFSWYIYHCLQGNKVLSLTNDSNSLYHSSTVKLTNHFIAEGRPPRIKMTKYEA